MTDQKAAEGPQERPGGGPATPRPPEGEKGAQAGAQRLAVFERVTPTEHCGDLMPAWVTEPRSECVLRPGHPGSHADDRGARWWCETEDIDWRQRAQQAEAALDRVGALATRLEEFAENALKNSDRQLYAALARDIRQRIDAPPAHNAGPTVAECAAQDRAYWTDKHAGEGQ